MFSKHIVVEVQDDMAIVFQVVMFDGSPIKRLILNSEGCFVEERDVNMQSDGHLFVHSAHIQAAQHGVHLAPRHAATESDKSQRRGAGNARRQRASLLTQRKVKPCLKQ